MDNNIYEVFIYEYKEKNKMYSGTFEELVEKIPKMLADAEGFRSGFISDELEELLNPKDIKELISNVQKALDLIQKNYPSNSEVSLQTLDERAKKIREKILGTI